MTALRARRHLANQSAPQHSRVLPPARFAPDRLVTRHWSSVRDMSGAPIELIALDRPYPGTITAQREGDPTFTHVHGAGDAIMAALSRGVDLVIPAELFAKIQQDLPPDLPSYIKIRH